MTTNEFSKAATGVIATVGSTAHQIIDAYRAGGERINELVRRRNVLSQWLLTSPRYCCSRSASPSFNRLPRRRSKVTRHAPASGKSMEGIIKSRSVLSDQD